MKVTRRTLLQYSAAAVAFTALPARVRLEAATETTSDLFSRITGQLLNAYPENATSLGLDKGKYHHLKSKLTDRSIAGQNNIERGVRNTLAELARVDTRQLDPQDALHLDVLRTMFEMTVKGFEFPYGDVALLNTYWSYRHSPYTVTQNTGAFFETPGFMDSNHTIVNSADADAYLGRMAAYADQLDGETERVRTGGELGVILPDFLMQKTLAQLRNARATPIEKWAIVNSIVTRTASMNARYGKQARMLAQTKIGPALERQIAVLEQLAPRATSNAGVWALPDGEAYYDWALQAGTTTTMTANEVHERGLEELAELHAEMNPILRSIGYTEGSVGSRMIALAKDPRYQFSEGDKGREEIMAFIHKTIDEIRQLMPQAFETLVPGFLEVTRIPVEIEDGAPGAYGGAGTVDGKQPGHYWINLRTPDLQRKYTLPDLTYHEAIPGHVWQGEYTFKQPLVRSLLAFNAYSEGWALYAQQIADELGVYDDFPVGRLGYLQSLAFRACRLVVDTGLHAKRWSREKSIDWFVTSNGSSRDEVQSEVDRYCAWPGQACGYKLGHSEILRLREKARRALGNKFDFRRFNDTVVLGGSVPMTVLGRVIDDYIEREKK